LEKFFPNVIMKKMDYEEEEEMWTRAQLKENGKYMFQRNYWECVAVSLIMGIFAGAASFNISRSVGNYDRTDEVIDELGMVSPHAYQMFVTATAMAVTIWLLLAVVSTVVKIFVGNVFVVGGDVFFIQNRVQKPGIGKVLEPFRSGHYGNVVLTIFLMNLYVSLWSLLLLIPGVIKGYEYRMVPYIIAENPGMDRKEVFAISKRMMDGEKWNTFVLDLSFLGWEILGVFTCGILLIFYVYPYIYATNAELYEYNKIKAYNEGYIR